MGTLIDRNKITVSPNTETCTKINLTGTGGIYNNWSYTGIPDNISSVIYDNYNTEQVKSNPMKMPKVKSIKTIGKKTFVYWQDGTFTKVTCERDQQPDSFAAFCIALTKKMYGSTSAIIKEIEDHDEAILRQKKKEANRKLHEEQRKKEREAFDKEVEKKRHELAVLRAAEKKLNGEA